MKLLLDSHALLWAMAMPEKLSERARLSIADPANAVFFSVASVWELELKCSKGKLYLPEDWLQQTIHAGFVEWKIDSAQAVASARLPWIHSDPFGRLLAAVAKLNDLTLVTRDRHLQGYGIAILEA